MLENRRSSHFQDSSQFSLMRADNRKSMGPTSKVGRCKNTNYYVVYLLSHMSNCSSFVLTFPSSFSYVQLKPSSRGIISPSFSNTSNTKLRGRGELDIKLFDARMAIQYLINHAHWCFNEQHGNVSSPNEHVNDATHWRTKEIEYESRS